MKELIGKTVKRIFISKNDETIVFDTDNGLITYDTYGDCCSSTWIESLTGVNALIGSVVLSHETIAMPPPKDREYKGDHYVDALEDYGEKLVTSKGYFDLVFRNSSNGYYGGSIGVSRSAPDISGFIEITDDWVAA